MLRNKLEELKLSFYSPRLYITEFCSRLRNQIDVTCEQSRLSSPGEQANDQPSRRVRKKLPRRIHSGLDRWKVDQLGAEYNQPGGPIEPGAEICNCFFFFEPIAKYVTKDFNFKKFEKIQIILQNLKN